MAIPHLVMVGTTNWFSREWATHQAVGWFCVALNCKLSHSNVSSQIPLTWVTDLNVLSYSVSYGPLAWVLPAEVFPRSKRAKGVGAATGRIWLANLIISVCRAGGAP